MKINRKIIGVLDSAGFPYKIVDGGKHNHIRVCGKLVGILPKGSGTVGDRAVKN